MLDDKSRSQHRPRSIGPCFRRDDVWKESCPTTAVIARLDGAIQYAAASRLKHQRLYCKAWLAEP
ncbi:hypothetical protein CK489_12025 [Bradyrhizobium sp. UFLA03-84]|nr:hypothetical protein CK489_12025 [Bradyrhizobium sp. UFLA03-84]